MAAASRAMQHANNDQLVPGGQIINGVVGVKYHAQVWTELLALRPMRGNCSSGSNFALIAFTKRVAIASDASEVM